MPDQTKNPLDLFANWFEQAKQCPQICDATAMSLATATKTSAPSNRIVLLKAFDKQGFTFYTNLGSQKSLELQQNPQAALCFYWAPLNKQIRIEGTVSLVDAKQADNYFASRDINSQIGAWLSKQSQPMKASISTLKKQVEAATQHPAQYKNRPPFWSGFFLTPNKIEFWESRPARLHARTLYTKHNQSWANQSLYP